jgi:hypothetical protein
VRAEVLELIVRKAAKQLLPKRKRAEPQAANVDGQAEVWRELLAEAEVSESEVSWAGDAAVVAALQAVGRHARASSRCYAREGMSACA